jgi:hypothetical protein
MIRGTMAGNFLTMPYTIGIPFKETYMMKVLSLLLNQ